MNKLLVHASGPNETIFIGSSYSPRNKKPLVPLYPKEYERKIILTSGLSVIMRPAVPKDRDREAEFLQSCSRDTKRFRFFGPIGKGESSSLIRVHKVGYDVEIPLIAEIIKKTHKQLIGIAHICIHPSGDIAEVAFLISDPWQKQGLGTAMMEHILDIARKREIKKLYAYTLLDNSAMLHLFEKFHFTTTKHEDMYKVELQLV